MRVRQRDKVTSDVKDQRCPEAPVSVGLVEWIESNQIGELRLYRKRAVIFSQGDPIDGMYVVKRGHIKAYSIARDGKSLAFTILGPGYPFGICDHLIAERRELTVEAVGNTEVWFIPRAELDHLLATSVTFLLLTLRVALLGVRWLTMKAKDLALLNVEQRLKHSLLSLARDQGGVMTAKGVKISVRLTHEDLAQLCAADRSTITTSLSTLRKRGYLSMEERQLVLAQPRQFTS